MFEQISPKLGHVSGPEAYWLGQKVKGQGHKRQWPDKTWWMQYLRKYFHQNRVMYKIPAPKQTD